jgi:hypothetical protein
MTTWLDYDISHKCPSHEKHVLVGDFKPNKSYKIRSFIKNN